MVPPRNKNFTGRDLLLDALRSGMVRATAVVPHALHGLGGVGKTQLAIEYAYRFRGDYDLVCWIPADQSARVRSTLAQLAPRLNVPGPATMGTEDAAKAVLEALRSGTPYSRWLLIFDNADEPEDLRELVLGGGDRGHVIVTSRNHRWESHVDTVAVNVFDRAESVQFFKKRMRRPISDLDADRLAEALGDLPLALEQAAALQSETGMSVEEYLGLLKDQTGRLLSQGRPAEYPTSMTGAWSLSVAKLKEHVPEALELLRCCAFFGPEPIPRGVFKPVEGPVRPVMADLLGDPIRLSTAIGTLGRYALVRIETGSGERTTLQVHRLIQALLREELSRETRREIRSEVHSLLAGAAQGNPENPANWPRYDALLAHVGPAEVAESAREDVRDFALRILDYLTASGNHRSAQRHVATFLEKWAADSGSEDPQVLRAQKTHGDLLRFLGHYSKAYALNTATLATMRSTLGNQHRETLTLLNGIGADLRGRGLFREARDHDDESVRLHKEVLGADHVITLRAVNNLALDYGLTSDYVRSRDLLAEALTSALQPERTVSPGTVLNLWTNLGRAVRYCGDYAEACDVGQAALAYGRDQFDADHHRNLTAQKDLAMALHRAGESADALELAEDVQARYVRLYGLDHPGTLAAATCLANALRAYGEEEKAFDLVFDTMGRYPKIYGAEHPYNYGCATNVAILHRVLGRPRAARELNEKALRDIERKLGRDHHYSLTIAVNLASDLAELDEIEQACALGADTHRRLRALLGERHPSTLAAAANLAADLAAAGRDEEAHTLAEETGNHYIHTLGPDHPDAVVAAEGRHLDCDFDPPPI